MTQVPVEVLTSQFRIKNVKKKNFLFMDKKLNHNIRIEINHWYHNVIFCY